MLAASTSAAAPQRAAEARYRAVFRRLHADHDACLDDEWLRQPCRRDGAAVPPVVWSRRNGAWSRVHVLFVGAAPGNAGGRGSGDMGAHGTRIPFGGDIAGANLDLLLGSVGLSRDDVFITAVLNRLPDGGGGEPTAAEIARPAGAYADSIGALRDTILASGATAVVALGNVALRACVTAAAAPWRDDGGRVRLPSMRRLRAAGLARGRAAPWPDGLDGLGAVDAGFRSAWRSAWRGPLPRLLWLLHPSAQNMSPHAGTGTLFHRRMVETVAALRRALDGLRPADSGARPADAPGGAPPSCEEPPDPGVGPAPRARRGSVYRTAEWRERVGPRHARLLDLWREKGLGPARPLRAGECASTPATGA